MQANAEHAFSPREQRIIDLASAINDVMRTHADRDEAIDAYDIARVLFRRTVNPTLDVQVQSEGRATISQSS